MEDRPPRKRKRERAANWTSIEKNIAVELIQSVIHILDNKSIKKEANEAKNAAYQEISQKFYERTGIKRQAHEIRSRWAQWKKKKRKELLEDKTKSNSSKVPQNEVPRRNSNVKISIHEEEEPFLGFARSELTEVANKKLDAVINKHEKTNNDAVSKKLTLAELIEDTYERTKKDKQSKQKEQNVRPHFDMQGKSDSISDKNYNRPRIKGKINSSNNKVHNEKQTQQDYICENSQAERPNTDWSTNILNNDKSQSKSLSIVSDNLEDEIPDMDEEIDVGNYTPVKNTIINEGIVNANGTKVKKDDNIVSRDDNSLTKIGNAWAMHSPDIDRITKYIEESLQAASPKSEKESEESRMSWNDDRLPILEEVTCGNDDDLHKEVPALIDHTYCLMPDTIKKEIENPLDENYKEQDVNCPNKDPLQLDDPIKEEIEEENQISNIIDDETLHEVRNEVPQEDDRTSSQHEPSRQSQSIPSCASPLRGRQILTAEEVAMKTIKEERKKELERIRREKKKRKQERKNKWSKGAIKEFAKLRRVEKQIEEVNILKMSIHKKMLEYLESRQRTELEMMNFEKSRKLMQLEYLIMLNELS